MEFIQLDIQQAKALIDREAPVIVDVRDPASFHEAHIPGAIALNDANIQGFLESADKSKPVLCYCYHGITSQQACRYFTEQGFKKVYNIEGGFEKWREANPTAPDQTNGF